MPRQRFQITSVLDGISPTHYFGSDSSYNFALGVDPDYPVSVGNVRTSGLVMPTRYEKFSGTATDEVDGLPLFIVNNPKDTNTYVAYSTGELNKYSSALTAASFANLANPGSEKSQGLHYYNNYIYHFRITNVARYGPLDNSPAYTASVWTGATLGSQPALINTTYPTVGGSEIPNHSAHVHTDNILYFCDYNTVANPGKGSIHKIRTTKTTAEGDTDNGSDNDALPLPFGFRPVDIESFNTDIAILAIQTNDTSINQGKACLFLWDTISTNFHTQIALPDPIGTALLNVNGVLYIWTGNATAGVRLSKYTGGYGVTTVCYQEEGTPPLAGAVDALGDRPVWGCSVSYPEPAGVVFGFGSKDPRLPLGLHCIARSTAGAATPRVTALKYVQQESNIQPRLVIGWGNA